MNKYRRWTPQEDELLIKIYKEKTLVEMAEIFDRHWNKVARRMMRLGIKKNDGHIVNHKPEWFAWNDMIIRCYNPKNKRYHRYGGRGITVCDRWLESFDDFLADMGKRPNPDLSLDRVDNNGNYEPGNCKWSTRIEQARNTERYKAKHGTEKA